MEPLFTTLANLCGDLERVVDSRVFVSLLRGLWEHLSDDLYIFVENLQESHDYHVWLVSAVSCVIYVCRARGDLDRKRNLSRGR